MIPDAPEGQHCLGRIALKKGKWKEAEEHFRKALELDPEDYESMNNLGVAQIRQRGQRKQAMDTFHQAVRMSPAADPARTNLHASARRYLYGGVAVALFLFTRLLGFWDVATDRGLAMIIGLGVLLFIGAGVLVWKRRKNLSADTKLMMRAHFRSGPTPWLIGVAVAGVIVSIIVRLN